MALSAATTYAKYLFAGRTSGLDRHLQAAALRGSGQRKGAASVTLIGAIVTIPVSTASDLRLRTGARLGNRRCRNCVRPLLRTRRCCPVCA